MARLVVSSLVKAWGESRAVDDISFVVEPGTMTVLLGPSGCGKSTTLRMLAGLDEPTSGSITIDGRDVAGLAGAARGVSMVFQSYALFPHMTVAANITFGLSVRHTPRAETAERLGRVAALLGLEPLLARKPGQLSGGQQQRVALARALISEAPVCLLDEPLSNLDAKLRQDLRHEIRALQQRLGITMIYVTHDQTEAMSMADAVILMNSGRIEQQGRPADLYDRPASLFAARFIGASAMNLLDPDIDLSGVPIGTEEGRTGLVLGLRPEDVMLVAGRPPAAGIVAGPEVAVADIEYLGADALASCRLPSGAVLNARVRGADAPAVGARLRTGWPQDAMHIFERDSGRRVDPAAAAGGRSTSSIVQKDRELSE
ncbi:MAG TPA: ABC transporter ATP-binding protein [Devosia sp.]|nr:ABC transporter ATP-binding protein [Devosia sp.]